MSVGDVVDLRNAQTLESATELDDNHGRVFSLAWSADSRLLATGSQDDNAKNINKIKM